MLFERIKLEKDEQLLRLVRKHWFILFERMIGIVFVTFFPFMCYLALQMWIGFEIPSEISLMYPQIESAILFLSAVWFLLNIMLVAYAWTDYYLDLWAITDRRVIAIDQRGFFSRSLGSFRLERLQDMNVEVNGLLATFLNFGIVEAQTASGSEEEFRAKGLPDPRGLKALILEQADRRMREVSSSGVGIEH